MREVLVLRHAEAAPAVAGEGDRGRPLTPRGESQARAVGAWLVAQGLRPDGVLGSSARRARATAELVLASWTDAPPVTWLDDIYDARPDTLLALLQRHPAGDRVMLVGHNPGVQQLVATLCPELPAHFSMPPATLARVALDGPAEPGCGRLTTLRTP